MTDYSDKILEAAPIRATRLLTGLGAEPTVRTLLARIGMSDKDIDEGRTLLLACLATPSSRSGQLDNNESRAQREAVAEIDQWDEPTFARARAALERFYPSVADYLFAGGLVAARGVESVGAVATFLARLTVIENGTDPACAQTPDEGRKAVDLLAVRGITREERERMGKLVQTALGSTPAAAVTCGEPELSQSATERRAKLEALRRWYDDWAEMARTAVKKRGQLIRLGLAKRRLSSDEADEESVPPPTVARPTPGAPVATGVPAASPR